MEQKVEFEGEVLTGPFYKEGATWDTTFGKVASPYEECRAECAGIYLCLEPSVLSIFGFEGATLSAVHDVSYINWLLMAHAGLKGLEARRKAREEADEGGTRPSSREKGDEKKAATADPAAAADAPPTCHRPSLLVSVLNEPICFLQKLKLSRVCGLYVRFPSVLKKQATRHIAPIASLRVTTFRRAAQKVRTFSQRGHLVGERRLELECCSPSVKDSSVN